MSERFCVECHRPLAADELQHLHILRFYAMEGCTYYSTFPGTGLLRHFEQWLRETHQVQLVNTDLPFLPPGVVAQERLGEATEALRLALGLPHVRSLLDLLDAVLSRLREEPA